MLHIPGLRQVPVVYRGQCTPTLFVPYSITGTNEFLYTVPYITIGNKLRTPTLFSPYIVRAKTPKLCTFVHTFLSGGPPSGLHLQG